MELWNKHIIIYKLPGQIEMRIANTYKSYLLLLKVNINTF